MSVLTAKSLDKKALPPTIVATQQEVDVLAGLAAGKTPVKAVADAGLDVGAQVAKAYCGGLKARYNQAMQDALLRNGVTVDKLAEKVAEQLDAQKSIVLRDPEGANYTEKVTDNAAVQGAINIALDILPGARAPKQLQVETRSLEAIILKIQHEDADDEW